MRNQDKSLTAIAAVWVFILLVNLAWLGLLSWGIYELVSWVTSK